jgi:hypothetical protein
MKVYFFIGRDAYKESRYDFKMYYYRSIWRFWKWGVVMDYNSEVNYIRKLRSRSRQRKNKSREHYKTIFRIGRWALLWNYARQENSIKRLRKSNYTKH